MRILAGIIIFLFTSTAGFGCAELVSTGDRWKNVMEGVQFVDKESWRFPCVNKTLGFVVPETRLTAYRFDRKKFEFVLLNPAAEVGKINTKKIDLGGTFLNSRKQFVRLGQNIGTIAEFSAVSGKFALLVPAGWWQDVDPKQPEGYLKIDGTVLSKVFSPAQSAILCLDDQTLPGSAELGHTIIVFFYYNIGRNAYAKWDEDKRQRFTKCGNVFQTGPRIVERERDREELLRDPGLTDDTITCLGREDKRAGICARASSDPTKAIGNQRVVLAADDRPSLGASERRRYYVIYFHNELPFYQIQSILLSDAFYRDGRPEWAVNLAGGNRSGISVRIDKSYEQYGNIELDLPSLLLVKPAIR